MSEKSTHKKERRRSSSSSSCSSTSSDSSDDKKHKVESKSKGQPRPAVTVNKVGLDIGYKIQQEELSDSEDSVASSRSPRARSRSIEIAKYPNVKDKKQDKSKSPERERYRSQSFDKRRERSRSKDSRKDRSRSKDIKPDHDFKTISKYDHSKIFDRKDRSKSIERKRERSRSRDRRKRRSKSGERKPIRASSRDKKKERSRSRERRRDRSKSKSKDITKEKRRERSRSREKRREKSYRESRSPIYYKNSSKSYSQKDFLKRRHSKSRERSSKRSRSRSRSRSRPRKRTRSRSRSFDRTKRAYDKKLNKLNILEKLGIELKVPEGQMVGEPGANTSGFSIPSYYNPAGVNPLKYAQQMQKKRLIWGSKKQEGEPSVEKKEEEKVTKPESAGPESVWKGTTFSQDQDGKLTAKFKRLMGIKDSGEEDKSSEKNSELIQKQEEMFSSMEKQYEVARVSTHTHRGLGLGFGVHLPR